AIRGGIGAVGKDPPQRLQAAVEEDALLGEGPAREGGEQDQEGEGNHADRAMLTQCVPHGSIPSSAKRNVQTSVHSSTVLASGLPWPWPARASTRRSTGRPDVVAACRRAAILRACIGSTRLSDSPVVRSTAGYAMPSSTRWYRE